MKRILVSALLAFTAACDALPTGGNGGPIVETEHEFTLNEGGTAVVRG